MPPKKVKPNTPKPAGRKKKVRVHANGAVTITEVPVAMVPTQEQKDDVEANLDTLISYDAINRLAIKLGLTIEQVAEIMEEVS